MGYAKDHSVLSEISGLYIGQVSATTQRVDLDQ